MGLYTITPFGNRSQFLTIQKYGNPKFQALYEPTGGTEWKLDDKKVQTWSRSSEQRCADRRKLNASPSWFAQNVPPHPHSMFKGPKARRASVDFHPRPPAQCCHRPLPRRTRGASAAVSPQCNIERGGGGRGFRSVDSIFAGSARFLTL